MLHSDSTSNEDTFVLKHGSLIDFRRTELSPERVERRSTLFFVLCGLCSLSETEDAQLREGQEFINKFKHGIVINIRSDTNYSQDPVQYKPCHV